MARKLKIVRDGQTPAQAAPETVAAQVPARAPVMPQHVAKNPELKKLWDQVVPGLEKAGLICPADGQVLEAMLMEFSLMRLAYEDVLRNGFTLESESATKYGIAIRRLRNPAELALNAHSRTFLTYAQGFGMNLASRARIDFKEDSGGDEDNPFAPRRASG